MRKTLYSCVAVVLGGLMIFAFAGVSSGRQRKPKTQFIAVLNTGEQLPVLEADPIPDGDGLGVAHLHFDPATKHLCVSMNVTGLSSAITTAHVHDGAIGANGPAVVPLNGQTDGGWRNFCGGPPDGSVPSVLTDDQVTKLQKGLLYLNVHTADFPNGEVRGQIYAQK